MKLAITILLLAAAIAAADQGGFLSLRPAAKDYNLSDDCVIASSTVRPFADICLEECGWYENKTFTELAELFEVERFLASLIASTKVAFHLLIF